MIPVCVNFKIAEDLQKSILEKKFLETAPMYKDVNGLIRKNYLIDVEHHKAGGVYTFDTLENAKAWFNQERIDWLTERYSSPAITYYETPIIVDNDSGNIQSYLE
jgi:hypothetical protein